MFSYERCVFVFCVVILRQNGIFLLLSFFVSIVLGERYAFILLWFIMNNLKILYSRNQVDLAWKVLINSKSSKKEKDEAFLVLNNWRAAHDYPMNTFQSTIRGKVKLFRFSALVVERLKRSHSILWKIERNPKMRLSRMQDIGWLRVVLRELDYVYKMKNSIIDSRFLHKLIREDDYIKSPKKSGYRSLHLVYRYKNKYRPDYDGLQVEIQLRTELQHIWATAVETMWIVLKRSLKSSEWPKKWLDFFALSSSMFALKEWCAKLKMHDNLSDIMLKDKLVSMEKELRVVEKMQAYSHAIKFIDTKLSKKKKWYEHYLLVLNIKEKTIFVNWFKSWELDKATNLYLENERKFVNENDWQVVLVSWEWLKELKRAYPNYFWDSSEFIKLLHNIMR